MCPPTDCLSPGKYDNLYVLHSEEGILAVLAVMQMWAQDSWSSCCFGSSSLLLPADGQLWLASAVRRLGLFCIQCSGSPLHWHHCKRFKITYTYKTCKTHIVVHDRKKKEKNVPHFLGFICLVLEVSFLRTGKGRKLETDPPTLES